MKRKFVLILSLFALLSTMLYVRFNTVEVKASDDIDPSKIYGIETLWNNSMSVYDVAVSGDGNYLAAVNDTGIFYFASDNSIPKWWYLWQNMFRSVAISADGGYVVAGDNTGHLCYFNDSRTATNDRSAPMWMSIDLWGPVERGTLDMSDDGEYVVVGGTGVGLYYFAGCTSRSSFDESPTWQRIFGIGDFLTVHISSDGRYVAAGGRNYTSNGFVMFYKDANETETPFLPNWISWSSIDSTIVELALSDDGYAVAAVGSGPLYYWANCTNLSDDPDATWTKPVDQSFDFRCVDMSADGDSVVAGSWLPRSLHFWSGAREREGEQNETWVRCEGSSIFDVAIDDQGGIIAATGDEVLASPKAYFFKSNGDMIDEFELDQYSPLISMSGNGLITTVAGPGWDSLYVFKTITDTTPPLIKDVYQVPANDSVYPTDDVMVFANVTDDLSGVKQVILNYTWTNSTGTWHGTVVMDPLELDIYNGTIPRLPYCTNVTYVIIAEDNFNNTVTTEEMGREYTYHVIPEFPPQFVLPLLVTATLLAMLLRKRKLIHQAKTSTTSKTPKRTFFYRLRLLIMLL